jgi:hypothetical protein
VCLIQFWTHVHCSRPFIYPIDTPLLAIDILFYFQMIQVLNFVHINVFTRPNKAGTGKSRLLSGHSIELALPITVVFRTSIIYFQKCDRVLGNLEWGNVQGRDAFWKPTITFQTQWISYMNNVSNELTYSLYTNNVHSTKCRWNLKNILLTILMICLTDSNELFLVVILVLSYLLVSLNF